LGVKAPLNFSVVAASGGTQLLGVCGESPFSVDQVLRRRVNKHDRFLNDALPTSSQADSGV